VVIVRIHVKLVVAEHHAFFRRLLEWPAESRFLGSECQLLMMAAQACKLMLRYMDSVRF
jgi:hypothetical protein